MKTSTFFVALIALNSGLLASQTISFIGNINPFVLGGAEVLFAGGYYVHKILKDVRNAFDVKVEM